MWTITIYRESSWESLTAYQLPYSSTRAPYVVAQAFSVMFIINYPPTIGRTMQPPTITTKKLPRPIFIHPPNFHLASTAARSGPESISTDCFRYSRQQHGAEFEQHEHAEESQLQRNGQRGVIQSSIEPQLYAQNTAGSGGQQHPGRRSGFPRENPLCICTASRGEHYGRSNGGSRPNEVYTVSR